MSMKVNKVLPLPAELKEEYPLSEELIRLKKERDTEIRDIFTGKSDKFAVIIGPCSADNEDSVCEYVSRLAKVNEKVKDRLMLIPRIYTNKPRTTGEGYKGMLHQPDPDKAPDLYAGIMAIRKMHIRAMKESGLTAADEMLYPENRSYLDDILSYEAVGARSVENQQHRLTASGMDIPVGMKNPTSGDLSVMLNSIVAAQMGHRFIYRTMDVTTSGKSMEETVPKVRGAANVEIVGLMVSLNRMEVGQGGVKSALDEIHEKYGFEGKAIVTMEEVVEHLYNRECQGRIVIDDTIRKAIDAYYEQYGCK